MPRPGGDLRAIVTIPPYAPFAAEIARHPLVAGFRLNTVMPIREPRTEVLARLGSHGRPLWVDLKGRQIRAAEAGLPPFTAIRLSHRIRVKTPCDAFFSDGREHARVAAVDGDLLIFEDGPRRVVGPGESVNIPDPSLEVEGTLTDGDRAWLEAMRECGQRRVLLSFVERPSDAEEVRAALSGAELRLKVESQKGLAFAREHGGSLGGLVAARGDLYVECIRPHAIVGAVRAVLAADPGAWVGSRLVPSLARGPVAEAADVGDAAFLLGLGYRTFVLGDEVCLRRDSLVAALELLAAIAGEMA